MFSNISKGGKEARLKEEGRRTWERGKNGWPYRYALPPADTQALRDFTLGLYPGTLPSREGSTGTQPYQKPGQTRTEPKFEFTAKRKWSVSSSQLRLRPFDQIPTSRTRGLEKGVGEEGLRRGRREGWGERSIKPLVPDLVGALWPVVCVRRRPRTKGSLLWPLGLVHWWPSWSPSGRDVSHSEEEYVRVSICCRKGDIFQGPKLGSCLTLGNEPSEEINVLTKQEILLGKGVRA